MTSETTETIAMPTPGSQVSPSPSSQQRRKRLLLRWYLHLAGFALALCGLFVVCGPTAPGEQQYLLSAAQARQDLRYDLALARYAIASTAAPNDPLPYCLTGDVRVLQQEWAAASAAYRRCAALDPQQSDPWRKLGDARNALGDTVGAATAWNHAAQLGNQTALRRLAQDAEQQGNVNAAIALWQRLPQRDTQALAHLGMLALWQGDLTTAQQDFSVATITNNPDARQLVADGFLLLPVLPQHDATTQGKLGHAFLAANLPALALAPFQHASALAPQDGEIAAYLGWTLLLLGQEAPASKDILRGLALAPVLSFAWFAAGELALAQQQPLLALTRFQQGTTLDPHNPLLWSEAGHAALIRRDYLGAQQLLTTASTLSTSPNETITLLHLYLDYHLGFTDGSALRATIRAANRWPQVESVQMLLAEMYAALNDGADTYYTALAAHQLDPTDPGPYVIFAGEAENEGDYVVAAVDLHIALALRPHGPFAAQATTLLAPLRDIPV